MEIFWLEDMYNFESRVVVKSWHSLIYLKILITLFQKLLILLDVFLKKDIFLIDKKICIGQR